MAYDRLSFWRSVIIVLILISVLWIVYFLQFFGLYDFAHFGNWPQHREGLVGIIFSPFIHGSLEHLVSNTLPIMVLLTALLNAYPRLAIPVLVAVHLISGAMVWIFAQPTGIHIGISGIIYGIAGFLVASGIFRKDRRSAAIAFFVVLVYGGMVVGFLPKQGVSWESHLYGALSGILMAFILRNSALPPPTANDLEVVEDDRHFFEQFPRQESQN